MRVVVVGGGIAGLTTAYYLQEGARVAGMPLDCLLVEKESRLGGKVVTHREGGFVVEGGPDSFLTQKPWAVELCRRLGLADQMIGTNEASRKVFILWKGKLRQLPDGVLLIVPTRLQPFVFSTLISPLGKLRMGLDLVIPPRHDRGDESVASFVRRRLGTEALEKIAEPLMGGIHTSDPERQSLLATFPRFADIERKHGSLVRGMLAGMRHRPSNGKALPAFMSLRGGLEQLVTTLAGQMEGVRFLPGRTVVGLDRRNGHGYQVRLDGGERLESDAVVLAMPAKATADLMGGLDGELARQLLAIRYVSTATVTLGYRQDSLPQPVEGFGFVIPSKENRRITASTFSSVKFDNRAPEGNVLLRCFLGSANNQTPALQPEEEMVRYAREELREMMGITAEPVLTQVYRWQDGHPQYDVGHLDRLAEIDGRLRAHPGLHLAGSSYRGVGLPDCIHSGALAAEAILSGSA